MLIAAGYYNNSDIALDMAEGTLRYVHSQVIKYHGLAVFNKSVEVDDNKETYEIDRAIFADCYAKLLSAEIDTAEEFFKMRQLVKHQKTYKSGQPALFHEDP